MFTAAACCTACSDVTKTLQLLEKTLQNELGRKNSQAKY